MRAIWKGSISFGLVNIPITLLPATRREELRFHFLRKSDMSPISNKRVADADGKEVAWEEIVRGYEYEKDQYVILTPEDFDRVDVKATQTVEIQEFVDLDEINPVFFSKPYYMEPSKGGEKAYALLRSVLRDSNKVGIAKVVLKTCEHLAAVEARGDALVLELMHFANEIIEETELHIPDDVKIGKKEEEMARRLVESMTGEWKPDAYKDEYRDALMKVIEEKIAAGGKELGAPKKHKAPKATNVIDLVAVLQKSIEAHGGPRVKKSTHREKPRKKAA